MPTVRTTFGSLFVDDPSSGSKHGAALVRGRLSAGRLVHPIAGTIAFFTLALVWSSTVVTELFGSHAAVVGLKTTVPWALLLLIPALAITGASGTGLAKGQRRGLVGAKAKRQPFIAAIGLLVLVPSALFLAAKARGGVFDTSFYMVQALDLLAGATNLVLLGMSMREGFAATAWKRGSFLRGAPTFSMSVLGKEEIAKGTLAIRVEKPVGFSFRPGQAVYVTVDEPAKSDDRGRIRTLSIASAPHERELLLATRIGDSAFKRTLRDLGEGAQVAMEGPFGDLSLHADASRPAVFLAGGIGITPFRSMILDAVERGPSRRIVLIYSDRVPESAAFLAELTALQQAHPHFELVATMTDVPPSSTGWSGQRGRITHELIARHVGDLLSPIYYVAGSPAMVAAMEGILRGARVASANIRAEMFTG